jgi:putative oxidoreductase
MAPRMTLGHTRAPILQIGLRILVSGIFGLAAFFKLPDPAGTHLAVYQYRLLSWEASEMVAHVLPWLEAFAALGLWIPRLALGAAGLGSLLSLLFLGALGSALVRDLDITCGCFGNSGSAPALGLRVAEDLLLLSFNLLLIRGSQGRFPPPPPLAPSQPPAPAIHPSSSTPAP